MKSSFIATSPVVLIPDKRPGKYRYASTNAVYFLCTSYSLHTTLQLHTDTCLSPCTVASACSLAAADFFALMALPGSVLFTASSPLLSLLLSPPDWELQKRALQKSTIKTKSAQAVHCGSKKNAPTLADYNYDPVQSIIIIFSKLFVNDHKSCLVVKFSTSPHICCHYTLWNTMVYFALITLLITRNAPTSDHHITSISVKEF